jgi:hypothetical protein
MASASYGNMILTVRKEKTHQGNLKKKKKKKKKTRKERKRKEEKEREREEIS